MLKDGNGTVNQCGVMSIVPMNYNTPEKGGTSEQNIYWGYNSLDISGKSDGLGRYDSIDRLKTYQQIVVCNKSYMATGLSAYGYASLPVQTILMASHSGLIVHIFHMHHHHILVIV